MPVVQAVLLLFRRWRACKRGRRAALLLLCAVGCSAVYSPLSAEEHAAVDNKRLFELEPYDLLTLKEKNLKLKLLPLAIKPRAPLNNRPPDELLEVRLVEKPNQRYAVAWQDIAEVELFEEMLLDEAEVLVKARRFDEAFEYFQVLEAKYAAFPGVAAAIEGCLFQEAAHWHNKADHARALALLGELHRRKPAYPNLRQATSAAVGKLVEQHMAAEQFAAARKLVRDLAEKYPVDQTAVAWQTEFRRRAEAALEAARAHQQAGRLHEAHREARLAVGWWPDLEDAGQLLAQLDSGHPVLTIAVESLIGQNQGQPPSGPSPFDSTPLASDAGPRLPAGWAMRRVRRLVERRLVEPVGQGDPAARYACPFGRLTYDAGASLLAIEVEPAWRWPHTGRPVDAFDVARSLLPPADPHSADLPPVWSELVSQVRVPSENRLEIQLKRPGLLFEASLGVRLVPWDFAPAGSLDTAASGPYLIDSIDEDEIRYRPNSGDLSAEPAQFQVIVEQRFEQPAAAIEALRAGRVAAIDRLPPWDVAALSSAGSVSVEAYALPTVHLLLPNRARPLLAQPHFRRALLYGIGREQILNEELLPDGQGKDGRILSGPFPSGYAIDPTVEPHGYDPRLALALAGAAVTELGEQPTRDSSVQQPGAATRLTLTLAHPPTEVARRACRSIQGRFALAAIGIDLVLKEHAAGGPMDGDYDLLYVEWPAMEPLVDARRLLGAQGLSGETSPQMESALRRLDAAKDWQSARRELQAIHRLVHDEVSILPLWQLIEYFARRRELQGVGDKPITLYQHLEQWQLTHPAQNK